MTTHLADGLLVELAERDDSHPHLEECERCRARVDELRALVRVAGDVQVPEPSPLFWEHFAANVGARIRTEQALSAPAVWNWRRVASWRPAALAAAALVVIVVVTWRSGSLAPGRPVSPSTPVVSADLASGADAAAPTAEDDETWALVTGAGAELDLDAATSAGFDLQPGSAEVAAAQLSPDEQRELVRLLQAAVAQAGS